MTFQAKVEPLGIFVVDTLKVATEPSFTLLGPVTESIDGGVVEVSLIAKVFESLVNEIPFAVPETRIKAYSVPSVMLSSVAVTLITVVSSNVKDPPSPPELAVPELIVKSLESVGLLTPPVDPINCQFKVVPVGISQCSTVMFALDPSFIEVGTTKS